MNVTGTSLDVIQYPKMYFQVPNSAIRRRRRSIYRRAVPDSTRVIGDCGNATNELMICIVPNMTLWLSENGNPEQLDYGFLMDDIKVLFSQMTLLVVIACHNFFGFSRNYLTLKR